MEPEHSAWTRLFTVPARAGTSEHEMLGGRLYRVLTCADASGTKSCVSSQVVWAPFQAMSKDAIPDVVLDKNGGRMLVSKNLSMAAQNQQYNVYLLQRMMTGIMDMRSMPPMRLPRFSFDATVQELLDGKATRDEIIDLVVYRQYEGRRSGIKRPR
jgi:hypothetical protein